MQALPLYPTDRRAAVERADVLDCAGDGRGSDCRLCAMHTHARTVCLSAEGEPGGLLVVGEAPGRQEDAVGRPFIGRSGEVLRSIVGKYWDGPVAYDNAVRCYVPPKVSKGAAMQKAIDTCRGYLHQTIVEVRPSRVITLGAVAARSVLGRAVAPFSNRRAFSFLSDGTPIIMVIHPAAALRNRFVRRWFMEDMEWALTVQDKDILRPRFDSVYRLVRSEEDARWAVAYMRDKVVAFDIEATGVQWGDNYKVIAVACCCEHDTEPIVWSERALEDPAIRQPLLDYLADPSAKKGGQNVKYDIEGMMCAFGVKTEGVVFDTRLQRKLLNADADASLDKMAELVGHGGCKEEMSEARTQAHSIVQKGLRVVAKVDIRRQLREARRLGGDAAAAQAVLTEMGVSKKPTLSKKDIELLEQFEELEDAYPDLMRFAKEHASEHNKWDYGLVDRAILNRYNARDALTTIELYSKFTAELAAEPDLMRHHELVRRAGVAAAQVEAWGVAIDRDSVVAFDRYLAVQETEAKKRLDTFSPNTNWNSPQQVKDILFNKLGLASAKVTKSGGQSTDKSVLEELSHLHPLPEALLTFRKIAKLRGTYAQGLLGHIRPDGRIHGSLNVDGARTGRTSFNDPNLQNVPRATSKEGKMARDCFIAPPGHLLVQADYSQLELRIAAMLSQDPVMISIFEEGVDYHLRTATMVAGVAWKNVTAQEIEAEYKRTGKCEYRTQAKSINFGVLYGLGDKALAKQMGCSVQQARKIREAIMGKLHVLDSWCQGCLSEARKTGSIWTWWDGQRARRRSLHQVADQDDLVRSVAEHGSWNTPVQGTASDFCIASLVEAVDWVIEDCVPAKVVLPVHDSIMMEVEEGALDEAVQGLRSIMLGWNSNKVPLGVDFEVGRSWGSLAPLQAA